MLTAFLRAPCALACALLLPALALAEAPAPAAAATPPPIEHFVERDAFFDIKISPDGKHLAANMPVERGTALFMLDTETLAKRGHFYVGRDLEVADFWWASSERLLISAAQRFLGDEAPSFTGEIFAVNVDGNQASALVGYRADDGRRHSRIRTARASASGLTPSTCCPAPSVTP